MFHGLEENRRGLKAVLENKKILKLIHDCRSDWDSLLYQYSIRIYNFIDTQEAYFVFKLFYYQEITLPLSLLKFIEYLANVKLEYKAKFKTVMNEDPQMWSKRPLSTDQLAYASEDVVYLINAWTNLRDKFNENMTEIIYFLSILKVVDPSMFNQFREYLVANIIYFSMLENVFTSQAVYSYLFSMDYIYNFLQIKVVNDTEKKNDDHNLTEKKNLLPDENYYNFLKTENSSRLIAKLGMTFKQKQRILSLKQYKEEEVAVLEMMNEQIKNEFRQNNKPEHQKQYTHQFGSKIQNAKMENFQNLNSTYKNANSKKHLQNYYTQKRKNNQINKPFDNKFHKKSSRNQRGLNYHRNEVNN